MIEEGGEQIMMKNRMGNKNVLQCIILQIVIVLLSAGILYAQNQPAKQQTKQAEQISVTGQQKQSEEKPKGNEQTPDIKKWTRITVWVMFLIIGGSIGFLFILQQRYLNACLQDKQLDAFSRSPAGLPEGTVRAMIAFIIITVSLYLCVLLFFKVGGQERFPEALSSLLGAVVGFYFGSRSGGNKGEGEVFQEEVKGLKTDIGKTEADKLLGNIKKGIDMTKVVMAVLPEEKKKKYGDILNKLEQGYETVQSLTKGGSLTDAVAKGQELFDLFKKDNPARDAYLNALGSFGKVLGGSVPAIALITTIVGVGVKLVGNAYEKWKNRVLNVPITPAILSLKVVDANTGFTLLLGSPIFKTVFTKELEGNDRPFMAKAAELLTQQNVDNFWNDYKDRFTTRAQFDQGLQEFRRAALDMELAADTKDTPEVFASAGGLDATRISLDKINGNEEAKAALHQLVFTIEELQKQGEPVPTIFEKVQKGVTA